jgi:diguanylate cyclase (GGDEF)-like protein
MGFISRASLVVRLWVTLSLLAVAFSAVALGTYTWLAVSDSVDSAHVQTLNKIRVIETSRFSMPNSDPLPHEVALANELGIRNLRLFGPGGREIGPPRFGALEARERQADEAFIQSATVEQPVLRKVRLDGGSFTPSTIQPSDVIRGGVFGEEYAAVIPVPNQPGGLVRMSFVVQYPDVSRDAQVIIKRSLWVALVIVSGLLIGMWLLLRLFVTHPMRKLSGLALRIAGGDGVRMPAEGSDELSELGRALNRMADALQQQATVDSLTGLYNLRHLSSNLEALIEDAKQAARPLSVIIGDLDNLKPVNDTYGHSAGDKLLQAVGTALRAWAGSRFTCWRVGGDEFAVALPNVGEQEALAHAAALRRIVSAIQLAEYDLQASISVGVATYPGDGEYAGALLATADHRMYALKAMHAEERRHATGTPDEEAAAVA